MNAMLLLVAMMFVLISIAGYQIVTLNQTFNTTSTIQQNQARIQVVTGAVRAGVTLIDGRVAVPVSADLTSTVPDISPFRTSANGSPLVYCPILRSDAADGEAFSNPAANESYRIVKTERSGMTYAVAGRPGTKDDKAISDLGIVAFVLVPQPNATDPLRCSDVTVASDGSTLLVKGGSVSPVFDSPVAADGASFVISPDGSRPEAALSSDRVVRSLTEVAEFVRHYDVGDLRLRILGGEAVSATDFQALLDETAGRTVRLVGADGGKADLKVSGETGSDLVELVGRGVMILQDVSLVGGASQDVAVASSAAGSLVLQDSEAARVRSNGGRVSIEGSSLVSAAHSAVAQLAPVVADGGSVTLSVSDSEASPAIRAPSSATVLSARGGDVVLKSTIHVVAPASAQLFRAQGGGRLRVAGDEVVVNVDRGGGFAPETYNALERASTACPDGAESCTAQCPAGKRVAWGECGSANGAPLASFSVDGTASAYTCTWSQSVVAMAPKAAVVCENP